MKNFAAMNRLEAIAARREIRENLDLLAAVYRETCDGTPAQTVAALAAKIGKTAAVETVANAVNGVSPCDGRISTACRAWAASIDGAASPAYLERMGAYSSIHPAHINQLAGAASAL